MLCEDQTQTNNLIRCKAYVKFKLNLEVASNVYVFFYFYD